MLEEAEAGGQLLPPLDLRQGLDGGTVEMLQGRGAIRLGGAGAEGLLDQLRVRARGNVYW